MQRKGKIRVIPCGGNGAARCEGVPNRWVRLANSINQYTSITGGSITNGLEHEISAFNSVAYAYINDERLSSATIASTGYTMVYDALGRCVQRTLTGGPTTYYVYDGEKPILEYDGSGTSVGTNVYGKGIDEIVKRVAIGFDTNSYTYYPQQNHEGSVIELTDTSGTVIERYRYDAFGAPTVYTGTWGPRSNTIYDNRFLFTGREYAATYRSTTNAAFNFYEYRARAYNPTLGRFMSEDPKLFVPRISLGASPSDWSFALHPEEAEFNLFRYCGNDPIDFEDPMGLDAAQAGAVIAGALVLVGEEEGFGFGTPPAHVAAGLTFGAALIYAGVKYFDHSSTAHAPPSKTGQGRLDARSKQPPPVTDKPHTIIERPGAKGQYTTYNGDGTSKQYRGSGKDHGGIARPNVKETTTHTGPDGKKSTTEIVRPAKPEEIPTDAPSVQSK